MVLAWVDHISNYLDRRVILYHRDPTYHPVIKGEVFNGRPIILEPGFSEDVDWFVIPWCSYGELMIDIDLPIKVVVGPHGATGSKDFLQFYNMSDEGLVDHWIDLGQRAAWWDMAGIVNHVHLCLTFANPSKVGMSSGEDVELVHFHKKDSFNVYALGNSEQSTAASEATGSPHSIGRPRRLSPARSPGRSPKRAPVVADAYAKSPVVAEAYPRSPESRTSQCDFFTLEDDDDPLTDPDQDPTKPVTAPPGGNKQGRRPSIESVYENMYLGDARKREHATSESEHRSTEMPKNMIRTELTNRKISDSVGNSRVESTKGESDENDCKIS